MKILVVGADGFVGGYLFKAIGKRFPTDGTSLDGGKFEKLDLSQFDDTYKKLEEISPDVICLAAGITNLDYIEEHKQETDKINVLGTKNVVDYCLKNNRKLIFFSSDSVFDGEKGPYSEDDKINPNCEYGKQKVEAEKAIKKLDDFVIIRTSSVYGWNKNNFNFVSRLIASLEDGKSFKAPDDQFYTPTHIVDLAKATLHTIKEKINGIYNVAGPDFLSRYDIGLRVCEVFGFEKNLVVRVKTSELNQKAKRPERGGLKNTKAVKELGIKISGIKEGLKDMMDSRNIK
jgi:dTDP-4-dehydrorhamnose reductase|tara:strand:- start:170 stop:1033 length:864 start_codon:yes stop_codon:yes gene_type:complete